MRPRDYLARRGARCVCDDELIAAVLDCAGTAENRTEAINLARKVLTSADGSFFQLSRWEISDFSEKGLSRQRACALAAAFEIGRRIEDRTELSNPLNNAGDIFLFFERKSLSLDREKCWVICLDVKNRVIRFDEISAGTAAGTLFHPRDFLRPAIRGNASKIVLVHNHPSGDASPSPDDVRVTKKLFEACRILEITLCDHIIIGRRNIPPHTSGFYSFAVAGLI